MEVSVDCERLAAWLAPMLQHAAQSYPVSRVHRLEARREPGGYRISEDGAPRGVEPTPEDAGYALTVRMHALALAALPDFTKIHAGCASWQGRRLLAVGPPRAGKTTLMTRLVFEGFSVHGDELALTRGGEVLPYPRRFGVRPPTVPLIPQLASARPGPAGGGLVTDPAELGFDWVIEAAPAAAVFYLEPNHGGRTRLADCPKYVMVQRVMSQSTGPETGNRQWIRDVCDMLDRAAAFTLTLGDVDEAVAVVKEALQRPPRVAA
jgi:hypothetical protein